jgi:hypothetical protein
MNVGVFPTKRHSLEAFTVKINPKWSKGNTCQLRFPPKSQHQSICDGCGQIVQGFLIDKVDFFDSVIFMEYFTSKSNSKK